MADKFSTTVLIDAAPATLWDALTMPQIMVQWMGDAEMNLEVETNWKINTPIFIRGFHHLEFENKRMVLEYNQAKKLTYSHLSSLSRLPDKTENYSILEFELTPVDKQTQLTLTITNFPTETIRKHLEFYWRGSMVTIKRRVEEEKKRKLDQDEPDYK